MPISHAKHKTSHKSPNSRTYGSVLVIGDPRVLVKRNTSGNDLQHPSQGRKGTDAIRNTVGQLAADKLVAIELPNSIEYTKNDLHLQIDPSGPKAYTGIRYKNPPSIKDPPPFLSPPQAENVLGFIHVFFLKSMS